MICCQSAMERPYLRSIEGKYDAGPCTALTRPKVAWEGQKRTTLHPLSSPTGPPAA